MPRETCSKEGCNNPVRARGICNKHYHEYANAKKPRNLCGCGCGESTIYTFVHGHHTRFFTNEEQARRNRKGGHRHEFIGPLRPSTYPKFYGRHAHRVVAEIKAGREPKPGEIVHHRNEVKHDFSPGNLEILESQSEHCKVHNFGHKK